MSFSQYYKLVESRVGHTSAHCHSSSIHDWFNRDIDWETACKWIMIDEL
jgi:hypothetical protein